MKLDEALEQVRLVQSQLRRTESYCCYRSATVAASGLFAFAAAIWASVGLLQQSRSLDGFLQLWLSVAVLSVIVIGAEMLWNWNLDRSEFRRQQTIQALTQFAPCLAAGALLTWTLRRHAPELGELLPGLWSVLFALGVFSSLRQLPRTMAWVGCYYLLSGCFVIANFRDTHAFDPWSMVLTFGIGQLMTSTVLRTNSEDRQHGFE